jgi:hypothetical protein
VSLEAIKVGELLSPVSPASELSAMAGCMVKAAAGTAVAASAVCLPFKNNIACPAGMSTEVAGFGAACAFFAGKRFFATVELVAFDALLPDICCQIDPDSGAACAFSKLACASVSDTLRAKHNLGLLIALVPLI